VDNVIHSPARNLMKLLQRDICKDDQSDEGTPHKANTNVSIDEDMFHHCYSF
jgi:hypothetical protein